MSALLVEAVRNRRSEVRTVSVLRVARLIVAGHDQLCVVRNMSPIGLMAEVITLPAFGMRAQIEFSPTMIVSGIVRWAADDRFGMEFDDASDVPTLTAECGDRSRQPRARAPRFAREAQVRLRAAPATPLHGTVVNISLGGIQLMVAGPAPAVATPVTVDIDGLKAGEVRWRRHGAVGVRLHRPLLVPDLAHWLNDSSRQPLVNHDAVAVR